MWRAFERAFELEVSAKRWLSKLLFDSLSGICQCRIMKSPPDYRELFSSRLKQSEVAAQRFERVADCAFKCR
jgi:hypothetical protein